MKGYGEGRRAIVEALASWSLYDDELDCDSPPPIGIHTRKAVSGTDEFRRAPSKP